MVAPAPEGYQPSEEAAERLIVDVLGGILSEDWRPFRDKEWRGVRDHISGQVQRWKPAKD